MNLFKNAHAEILLAQTARKNGFEGRARVLSRRAAGMAIREYITAKLRIVPTGSLFDHLVDKETRSLLPAPLIEHLEHLCMKVNDQYQFPAGVDLIADANVVISLLEANMEG